MKKLIAVILLSAMVAVLIVGCGEMPAEVSRKPVDVRYTEAYESMETGYQYKYDWLKGDFVLEPVIRTVRHEAKWEIQYRITYDNGKEKTEWCSCTKEEYNRVKVELNAGGD